MVLVVGVGDWGVCMMGNGRGIMGGESAHTHKHTHTDQLLVVDLLSDKLVFAERVARLSGDGVDWPFLHLLLNSAVQHEQWLSCTFLQNERQKMRDDNNRGKHLKGQEIEWHLNVSFAFLGRNKKQMVSRHSNATHS